MVLRYVSHPLTPAPEFQCKSTAILY